jgi:predicted membrane protein (TIGR00267 family)
VAAVIEPAEVEAMRARLTRLPEPPVRATMTRDDWVGAVAVFLLVFLSTFPVVIPFIVVRNTMTAMRVSNAVAIAMLFATGCAYGRLTRHRPIRTGLAMVVLGLVLVGITMALGG